MASYAVDRSEVYRAIDGEREYQKKWNDKNDGYRSIDEFAHYMNGYMVDLTRITTHGRDPDAALDVVRKVAALGVACMEWHGAPERKL